MEIGGEQYVSCHLADISHEKRRRVLERVFFHDVLNSAGNIESIADMIGDMVHAEGREWLELLAATGKQIVAEIRAQEMLLAAETGELDVAFKPVRTRLLLETVAGMHRNSPIAENRFVTVADAAADIEFNSDDSLLARVLINLVRNALEASLPGAVVTLDCQALDHEVEFRVHNPAVMPDAVKRQVFTRSFSTKGKGRGLGTYSVKLLTEQYLRGSASFRSTAADGTTFLVRCPRR
jgi:signal transduction histidine kinase